VLFLSKRGFTAAAICAGVVVATAGTGMAQAAQQQPAAARSHTSSVIVMLRDQHTGLAMTGRGMVPRVAANASAQGPLLARARSLGATHVHGFQTIDAFSATVTPAQEASLAADPAVGKIFPNLLITAGPSQHKEIAKAAKTAGKAKPAAESQQICPADPAKPLLEPEALQLTHTAFADTATPQAQNIVTGEGVKVGFIADGLDINNPDFIRANGQHVFFDYQDFSGDGTAAVTGGAEAFGDASAIAAQGRQVYDLSNFVIPSHPLPPGCTITVRGMAPGASLAGLKVFGNSNTAPTSRFIEAIDYAVNTDHVDVLNESFSGNPFPDNGNDPISLADKAAVAAGVTVVASTGDAGTTGTTGSPATEPFVISAGASTDFQSYIQTGGAGEQLGNGTFLSNNISGLSSGGTSQQGRVPDVVAPGDLGWALCTPNLALYTECTNDGTAPSPIQQFGGTSQASPETAGEAALVIEAYRSTHHGASPTPALVKQLITGTATDLDTPAYEQGSGLINSLAAVQAAESWKDGNGSPAATGSSLVSSPTQTTVIGQPGGIGAKVLTVRNVSGHRQTVHATTRAVGRVVSSVSGTDTLNTATSPAFVDQFGIPRSYVEQKFTVRPNVDRLDVTNAAALPDGFSIRVILLDPAGRFTAYSIPQGFNNFSHVDVHSPVPGSWTLISAASTSAGFNGPVHFNVTQSDFTTEGAVVPATRTLAPGQTGVFTVHVQLPRNPGDVSASVQLSGSSGDTSSVPLTLRTVVPPHNTTFTGAVTGGNGRAGGPAQSNIYYLQVPPGQRDLAAGFTFSDPNDLVLATLTAPDGQVYSFQSNGTLDSQNNLSLSGGLQIYRRDPQAGTWVLSVDVTNPVSGLVLSAPFTAKVAYNTVRIQAQGLPDSPGTQLAAGTPVSVPVKITNTGNQPLTYFADGRLDTTGTIPLAELSGSSTVPLPVPAGINPIWLDPTETQQLTLSVTADQPVNADFFYNSGEPDQYSPANGNGATVQVSARQVSPGIWVTDIGQTGPFGLAGAPAGTATLSAQARGNLFDPAVTSTTGDIWTEGVDPATAASQAAAAQLRASARDIFKLLHGIRLAKPAQPAAVPADNPPLATGPVTLAPGQSTTITVTITPAGASGSTVRGTLYIDDFNGLTDGGDELAAFPYTYRIK
jgi:hypothetical protein